MVSFFWLVNFFSVFFVVFDFGLEQFDFFFFICIVENILEVYKEFLENERKNFQLVKFVVRDFGGVFVMIYYLDMFNIILDEKVSKRGVFQLIIFRSKSFRRRQVVVYFLSIFCFYFFCFFVGGYYFFVLFLCKVFRFS